MESIRFQEMDLRREAGAALMRMAYRGEDARAGDLRAAADYYARKYGVSADRFAGMIEAYEHVKIHFICEETELVTLFAKLDGLDLSLWQLLSGLEISIGAQRIGDLGLRIALVLSEDDEQLNFERGSITELMDYLRQQQLSDGVKWLFADAVIHYTAYQARVDRLLDQAEALLREKAHLLDPYAKQLLGRWNALPDDDAFFALLEKRGLRLDCRRADVTPLVLQFTSIIVHSNIIVAKQSSEEERAFIFCGVLIDEIDRNEQAGRNELESISGILHALDDKKRLQILTALHVHPLYGQEIASVTELSPATISHHMSELANAGLVTIEKQGVRLLYHLNETRLKEFTAMLENSLLR